MFDAHTYRRRVFSNYLKFTETPTEGGSVEIGNSATGVTAYTESASGLPNEGGISELVPPGAQKSYLGPSKSIGGLLKSVPELIQCYPVGPKFVPDRYGLIKFVPAVIGVVAILAGNLKDDNN